LNYLYLFQICLLCFLGGCETGGYDYPGDTTRDFAPGIKPEILDAKLIDENGNEVETRVVDGNTIVMPRQGQKIGFTISFRTSKEVSAEVIVSQYTPMELVPVQEPVYCEGLGCPDPEKGEISYYGEEIFSGTPYQGPQRFDAPPQVEDGEALDEVEYQVTEEATYNEHYMKQKYYYTVDHLGNERMFRFQVEDSAGYISRHLVIYSRVPL
jgi:hypothetical protein